MEKMDFTSSDQDSTQIGLNKELLKLSLSLYNIPQISRADVNTVLNIFDDFLSRKFIPFVQDEVERHVKPLSNDASLSKTYFILKNAKDIFRPIATEHLRFKLYEKNSFFIRPQLFEVGKKCVYSTTKDKNVNLAKKSVYAVHISMQDTLMAAFSMPGVLEAIFAYMSDIRQEKETISNVIQGELWAKKYEDSNKIVLPIYLYFDEFETRNALGSHTGEEK